MELAGARPPAVVSSLQWGVVCLYRQLAPVRDIIAALRVIYQETFSNDAQEWIVTSLLRNEFHTKFVRDPEYQRQVGKYVPFPRKNALNLNTWLGNDKDNIASLTVMLTTCRRLCKALMTAAECGEDGVSNALASEFQQRQIQQQDEDGSNWCRKVWTYGPLTEEVPDPHWQRNPELNAQPHHGFLCLDVSHNMLAGSTGCHEWEAGFWLAEFALNNPELFRGEGILKC